MNEQEQEKRKKELTEIISAELKKTFNSSSSILDAIQKLESLGLSVDITILTAISIGEKVNANHNSANDELLKQSHQNFQLTKSDRHFLNSLKITY